MIDERSTDGIGWARFSDDRKFRYRLSRVLHPLTPREERLVRVTFVMLNPSTADAFKLDPTVRKCCEFARLWGADVLEVVNLFALRSPYPEDLDTAVEVGDDPANDEAIMEACTGAARVVAAWGNHGYRWGRGHIVADRLKLAGIPLSHLGMTGGGYPLHPLARGKAFIPLTREPQLWGET